MAENMVYKTQLLIDLLKIAFCDSVDNESVGFFVTRVDVYTIFYQLCLAFIIEWYRLT